MAEQVITQPPLVEATFYDYSDKEEKTYIGFLDNKGTFHYVVEGTIGTHKSGGIMRNVGANYIDKVVPLTIAIKKDESIAELYDEVFPELMTASITNGVLEVQFGGGASFKRELTEAEKEMLYSQDMSRFSIGKENANGRPKSREA